MYEQKENYTDIMIQINRGFIKSSNRNPKSNNEKLILQVHSDQIGNCQKPSGFQMCTLQV